MHWLLLLLAIAALAIALKTASMPVMVVCLLLALVLLAMWMLGWYGSRVGNRSRDDALMLDPAELRRLREQAEARRLASAPTSEPPAP
jgi:hypothetical protein